MECKNTNIFLITQQKYIQSKKKIDFSTHPNPIELESTHLKKMLQKK